MLGRRLTARTIPLTFEWDLDNDGQFDDASGVAPALDAASLRSLGLGDDGVYPIAVLVDDGFDSVVATSTLTVQNVSPSILAFDLVDGAADRAEIGEAVALDLRFDDSGLDDRHTVSIDWGDGSDQSQLDEGARSARLEHVYQIGGRYDVTVVVADDDGGSDDSATSVLSVGIRVVDGELQIVGSQVDDFVLVTGALFGKQQGEVKVINDILTDRPWAAFTDVDRVRAWLGAGDDVMILAGNVDLPALIDGQAGNDLIVGGRGASVLLGGSGNDLLFGGRGADLLIGGEGSDRLHGSRGGDILIGGHDGLRRAG